MLRIDCVRRIGYVARLLSRTGVIARAAAISPYRDVGDEVRRAHESPFVETFVDCSLDQLVRRDGSIDDSRATILSWLEQMCLPGILLSLRSNEASSDRRSGPGTQPSAYRMVDAVERGTEAGQTTAPNTQRRKT